MRRAGVVRALQFVLVLVLCVELAVWECFLVSARPFGQPLPVAALLAVVANVVIGVAGARSLGSRWGAVLPGALWLTVALVFGSAHQGDRVIPDTNRGLAFLLLGTVAAAGVAGAAGAKPRLGATPEGRNGR